MCFDVVSNEEPFKVQSRRTLSASEEKQLEEEIMERQWFGFKMKIPYIRACSGEMKE